MANFNVFSPDNVDIQRMANFDLFALNESLIDWLLVINIS
jgi:hypothetical protein